MLIAEAVDTLITLGWALAVWIVVGAVVVTVALYAVLAVGWLAWHGARRACRGAWRGRGAPEKGSCDSRRRRRRSEAARAPPVALFGPGCAHRVTHNRPIQPSEAAPERPAGHRRGFSCTDPIGALNGPL